MHEAQQGHTETPDAETPDEHAAEGGSEQRLSAEELALAAGGNIGPEGQQPGGPPGPGGGLGGRRDMG